MKRSLSLLLTVLMACLCFSLSVFAKDKDKPQDIAKVDYVQLAKDLEAIADEEPYVLSNLYRMIAENYQRKNEKDQALEAYQSALIFSPSDENLLNVIIDLYMQKQDLDNAIKYSRMLIETADTSGNIYYYQRLANLYEQKGDKEKAAKVWENALASNKDNADLRRQIAENYAGAGDYKSAVKEINAAIAIDPANIWYKRQLARYLSADKDTEGAIEVLIKAAQDSKDPWEKRDIAYELAALINQSDDSEKVAAPFRKKIDGGSADLFDYWLVSQICINKGDQEGAISVFEKAVKKTDEKEVLWQLINLYQNTSQMEKAEAVIKAEISKNPSNSDAVNRLADLYINFQKYDEAVSALKKAQQLMPENVYFAEREAEVYAMKGDKDKAIARYRELLDATKDQWQKEDIQRRIDNLKEMPQKDAEGKE